MIGNLTGIGKTTSGGSSTNNLVYKKIYKSGSTNNVTVVLPDSINTINDLIDYMWNNLPVCISWYNNSSTTKRCFKLMSIGCGGMHNYLYFYTNLQLKSQYDAPTDEPIDENLFVKPSSLLLIGKHVGTPSSIANVTTQTYIDDTWTISNM